MNKQPCIMNGYYIHYKKKPYQLVDITTNSDDFKEYITYQSLYFSEDFKRRVRWSKLKEEFFLDVEVEGKIVPRFTFAGTTLEELKAALKKINSPVKLQLED
ncbi:MAG: DUF1653 domain-containing protein [Candidatus Nanoarchaeia archaeon]